MFDLEGEDLAFILSLGNPFRTLRDCLCQENMITRFFSNSDTFVDLPEAWFVYM